MKLKNILFAGLLLATSIANAQTDFRLGYVIKAEHDTLAGEIDYRGDIKMSQFCKFRSDESHEVVKFSPNDILGFRFVGSKYFVSKEVEGNKVFLEFLIQGKINMYYLRDSAGDHFFLEKEEGQVIELPYNEGITYIDGKEYAFKTKGYIGILNHYMQDAPALKSRIDNIKKPEQASLIKLAEDYHNIVCKDGVCIIYEKRQPGLKINLEATSGLVNFNNQADFEDKTYFMGGLIAHIWMPRTNEKLYLRTGLLFSVVKGDDGNSFLYKVPIQFEYMYPKGIFRPVCSIGVNVYYPYYQTIAFMAGLNIRLAEKVDMRISYDIDFGFGSNENFSLIPKTLSSMALSAGIVYNF